MSRVLVAGAGYVGARLAVRLRSAGHEVFAIRRSGANIDGVENLAADLTKPETLALPEVDVAFFTAAPDDRDEASYRSIYVDGSRNLRRALGERTRLVFTSSTAVYAQNDGSEVDESSPTQPDNFRGSVLLEAESTADVALRLGGIYGPERARALDRLRRGEARSQPGRYLNFIHREDAAGALEHLTQLARPESVYVGVDEEPVESETFYRFLAERLRSPVPPADEAGSGRGKRCSSARLRASGYVFRYPTFRDGFGEIIERLRGPELSPCPSSPNCVSTRASDAKHRMPPLSFTGSVRGARDAIVEVMRSLGGRMAVVEENYLRAEFTSRIFRFVDDVEWAIDAIDGRLDFRSASRVGFSDLGVNRRRMRTIVARLTRSGNKFSVCEAQ